ncbi:hypothetical protein RDI58_005331 [Solanum bulbocastanum]|uniref:Cystatin domain-containing protein n=1 Tax=Solanum bulbocastanum TaxID=147425 RepID=A0AAN8U337_SOLBU
MATFVLLTSLSILVIAFTCSSTMRVLDETPIDPNDPKVVKIARFAVDERNKQVRTKFELEKVNAGGTETIPDEKRANFVLLTSLSILVIVFTCSSAMRVLDEISVDPNDPNVMGIAKFVVDKRNKQAQTNSELVKVNAGGTEAIHDGTVYQLNITVTESQISTTRLLVVLVHPDGSRELMFFE